MFIIMSITSVIISIGLVRSLQRRKQQFVLEVEEEHGVCIEEEGVRLEQMRILTNFLLMLIAVPFTLIPFAFFIFANHRHSFIELLPVVVIGWSIIYFWFGTEQFNVFSRKISYAELLTVEEAAYFKRGIAPYNASHQPIHDCKIPEFIQIRAEIREYMKIRRDLEKMGLSKEDIQEQMQDLSFRIHLKCWKFREKE